MNPPENEGTELTRKFTPEEIKEINARADRLLSVRENMARLVGGRDRLDQLIAEAKREEIERRKPRPFKLPPAEEINAFADRLLNARKTAERILGRRLDDLAF